MVVTGEKQIILAGFIIVGLGAARSFTDNKPVTPVLEGSLVAILLLSLLAAFGEQQAKLAGAMALLVALSSIFINVPYLLKKEGYS